jgi:hypothetical protein
MKPSKQLLEQMAPYQWVVNSNPRGLSGPQLGTGSGQSTEFMDHRVYVAGDDVRRIDWNATARTDQLLIKRYQEEIRPSVVLLVDDSKSMAVYEDKLQRTKEGVAWIHQSLSALEASSKALRLHQGALVTEQSLRGDWSPESTWVLAEGVAKRVNEIPQGAHVILLTDLLSPHEPSRVAAMLRQRAYRCTVIQILGHDDWAFESGTFQVQDSETGQVMQLTVEDSDIDLYHARIEQLRSDWRDALAGWGDVFCIQSPMSWPEIGRVLLQHGLVEIV